MQTRVPTEAVTLEAQIAEQGLLAPLKVKTSEVNGQIATAVEGSKWLKGELTVPPPA